MRKPNKQRKGKTGYRVLGMRGWPGGNLQRPREVRALKWMQYFFLLIGENARANGPREKFEWQIKKLLLAALPVRNRISAGPVSGKFPTTMPLPCSAVQARATNTPICPGGPTTSNSSPMRRRKRQEKTLKKKIIIKKLGIYTWSARPLHNLTACLGCTTHRLLTTHEVGGSSTGEIRRLALPRLSDPPCLQLESAMPGTTIFPADHCPAVLPHSFASTLCPQDRAPGISRGRLSQSYRDIN